MIKTNANDKNYSNLHTIFEILIFSLLICVFCSCTGPSVRYQPYVTDYEPKPSGAPIDVFMPHEDVRGRYKVIDVISIGDTALSVNCDWIDVIDIAKEKARTAGGDAIQITNLMPPDFPSTCYRITANILKAGKFRTRTEVATGTGFAVASNCTIVTAFFMEVKDLYNKKDILVLNSR